MRVNGVSLLNNHFRGLLELINLLIISKDTSHSLDKNMSFLEEECSKLTNLSVYRDSANMNRILKKTPNSPDFILLANDLGKDIFPVIHGLSSVKIPVGLLVHDVHRFTESRRHFIRKNQIRHLFSVVRDKFYDCYPEYINKMTWLPHWINPHLYKDYRLNKEIDLLMMGAVNPVYPFREKVLQFYQSEPNFIYHRHPGYGDVKSLKNDTYYIGEKYAKEINRAKIFFTCPSIYHYPVKKYFEALACNTLLLAPTFKELEDLGFIPGTHFVAVNEHNFMEKAKYYLENKTERNKIARQGYEFIHKSHSLPIRARQLVKSIDSILRKEKNL